MSAPAAVPQFVGARSAAEQSFEDKWYVRSMDHPRWLIPPPSGGSSGRFTSPTRGRAKSAFRLDPERQEDRGGPQPTSSEGGRGDLFAAAALWFAYIGRRLQTGGRLTPPALMSAPQAVPRRGRRYTPAGNQLRGTAV